MARTKKTNETENEFSENERAQSIPESENTNAGDDNGDSANDAGTNTTDEHAPTEEVNIDEILSQFSDKKEKRARKKKVEPEQPPMIPGALLVEVTDSVGVSIASLLDGFLSKKPIDAQLLALRPDQKEKLVPLADACVIELQKMIQLNPIGAFFGTFAVMQLSNYLLLRMMLSRMEKQENEERR